MLLSVLTRSPDYLLDVSPFGLFHFYLDSLSGFGYELMYFKFSSHCLLFSAILVLIRFTSVECILPMFPFD